MSLVWNKKSKKRKNGWKKKEGKKVKKKLKKKTRTKGNKKRWKKKNNWTKIGVTKSVKIKIVLTKRCVKKGVQKGVKNM